MELDQIHLIADFACRVVFIARVFCGFGRGNTSLLIDYCQSDGKHKYIQIDVGKTFREQVLRWFTLHKIPQVDSVSRHQYRIALHYSH